ncbi:hypothetical protein [Vreelandella venusta]|uniref:hypothetical protein n=1 Tax=Vreelandella venusta TaxID=44935 RepID=UPI00200E606C|nr:hypothetical protein [Halomonas venusta]UQI38807.1 hypothetical protein M3L73_11210 [Halomonas venusta]
MHSSKLLPNKWDVWTTIFWSIAFLTIPVAIYLISTMGFVEVPSYRGSYSTKLEVNPSIWISSIALSVSALFAAAFFGVINDIYKRTFSSDLNEIEGAVEESPQEEGGVLRVKTISEDSPLQNQIKVGWRLTKINGDSVLKASKVSQGLFVGNNSLEFIDSEGDAREVVLDLAMPPRLGITLG